MKPTNTLLLEAAFAAYNQATPSEEYTIEGKPIINELGLHATIYRHKNNRDYILSFRGTEEPSSWEGAKDWANNFNDGWPQFQKSRNTILDRINQILERNGQTRIHIVGHSLGGALAQFTAYDVGQTYYKNMNSRITLTTWNALGGQWGLTANEGNYNPSWLNGIDGTHFFRHDDLVARLGGNHVGGKKIMLLDPEVKMESALNAHMKPELEQALLHGVSLERDPLYAYATRYTREFLGTALAGLINMADPTIEGTGIINLTRTVIHATIGHGLKVAAVELGAFLWQYLVQRIADYTLRDKDGLKTAITEIVDVVSDDRRHFKWLAEKMMDSVLKEMASTAEGTASLDRESIGWISEVLEEIATNTEHRDPEISDYFQRASQDIIHPVPGLPLSSGDFILLFGPGLYAVKMGMGSILAKLQSQLAIAESGDRWSPIVRLSPLVFDLDGDGIETVGTETGVQFDHNGNGYAERTGWIGPDDGLLAFDRDQNGNIDNGNELFGNHYRLNSGSLASNGFLALADLDSDSNKHIDSQDIAWDRLAIWQDLNLSGSVDPGELNSLVSHGIAKISLEYTRGKGLDWDGNDHREQGKYFRSDGSALPVTDVWFATNMGLSRDLNIVPMEQDLSFVPDLEGSGNVPSLHQAIVRDQSGELGRLLKLWHEVPHTQHATLIESVIYQWAGVAHQGSGNPRLLNDQRILSALEAFTGKPYRNGNEPVHVDSAFIVITEFKKLCLYVTGLLNSHPHFTELLSKVRMTWDREANRVIWNVDPLLQHLREQSESKLTPHHLINLQRAIQSLGDTGSELLQVLRDKIGSSRRDGDLKLRWLVDKQVVVGSDESEVLHLGTSFSNTIHGGGGNDHIKTRQDADLLDGGDGDDILDGDLGDDIYLFRRSFGQDRIHEAETFGRGFDTAIFADHASTDVQAVEQQNGDLILRFHSGDVCTIARYANDAAFHERIDLIRFADGVEWRRPEIMAHMQLYPASTGHDILAGHRNAANQIDGLRGNDLIWGGNLDDHLHGNLGHDLLFGGEGDDWLRGGRGSDQLIGGGGRDHYLFARADGEDIIRPKTTDKPGDFGTILFDAGVLATKLSVTRDPDKSSLLLSTGVMGDRIRIEEFFLNDTPYHARNPIGSVRFSDGTSWNTWELLQQAMRGTAQSDWIWGSVHDDGLHGFGGNDYLSGGAGNDQLHGNEGDDVLEGGANNDSLYGGMGNNTYRFSLGHGQDIIMAESVANPSQRHGIIKFDASIPLEAIEFQRRGQQLLITSKHGADSISVQEFFRDNTPANTWNPITSIEFQANQVSLTIQDILSRLLNSRIGTAGNDHLEAPSDGSTLHGFGGDDLLIGSAGDDLLDGGDGVDTASYARASHGVVVDLSLRTSQDTRGAGIDTLAGIENLVGSSLADQLAGSDGANHLDGGDGDDILVGSAGADSHRGGAGADLFLYRSALEVGHGVRGRDRILDFADEDRVDLRLLDADLSRPGDQAFVWIGEREFSAPGQLRYAVLNGQGLLKGNLSGATSPEFTLVLEGGFRLDPTLHLLL